MKIKEKYPRQKLLVEGNDDQHVIWALCEKYKITENFDVIDSRGYDELIKEIPLRFKTSDLKTLGIIVDADENVQQRWEALRDRLRNVGFSVPDEIPSSGLLLSDDGIKRKVGVWIMPDNKTNGILENFISFLVPSDDRLFPFAQSSIENIESAKFNRYKPKDRQKALIHTWLAWQEDPGTPLGLSITKRYLTTDEDICQTFIEWLQTLFAEEA